VAITNCLDYPDSWLLPLNSGINATWISKPNLPFLSNHMSYVSAKGDHGVERYFFLGGQLGGNEYNGNRDDLYEYDAVNETWTEWQKMTFPRGHASASTVAVSCGFIVAGGAINSGVDGLRQQTSDVSYYDIPSNTWTHIGHLSQNVRPFCAIDFVNNYLYCETGSLSSKYSSRIRIEV
jgi:N-acetylneuraminic acid mutarotase